MNKGMKSLLWPNYRGCVRERSTGSEAGEESSDQDVRDSVCCTKAVNYILYAMESHKDVKQYPTGMKKD